MAMTKSKTASASRGSCFMMASGHSMPGKRFASCSFLLQGHPLLAGVGVVGVRIAGAHPVFKADRSWKAPAWGELGTVEAEVDARTRPRGGGRWRGECYFCLARNAEIAA